MLKEIQNLEKALAEAKVKYKATQTPTVIKPEFQAFEVYHEDLKGCHNWEQAKKACIELGNGWRLPTKVELNEMYERKDEVGGFADLYYWSSTEFDPNVAWGQGFDNGFQYDYGKYNNSSVRPVRALTI